MTEIEVRDTSRVEVREVPGMVEMRDSGPPVGIPASPGLLKVTDPVTVNFDDPDLTTVGIPVGLDLGPGIFPISMLVEITDSFIPNAFAVLADANLNQLTATFSYNEIGSWVTTVDSANSIGALVPGALKFLAYGSTASGSAQVRVAYIEIS